MFTKIGSLRNKSAKILFFSSFQLDLKFEFSYKVNYFVFPNLEQESILHNFVNKFYLDIAILVSLNYGLFWNFWLWFKVSNCYKASKTFRICYTIFKINTFSVYKFLLYFKKNAHLHILRIDPLYLLGHISYIIQMYLFLSLIYYMMCVEIFHRNSPWTYDIFWVCEFLD